MPSYLQKHLNLEIMTSSQNETEGNEGMPLLIASTQTHYRGAIDEENQSSENSADPNMSNDALLNSPAKQANIHVIISMLLIGSFRLLALVLSSPFSLTLLSGCLIEILHVDSESRSVRSQRRRVIGASLLLIHRVRIWAAR